ncbi:hypothetical protein CC85DRAFT_292369 [Cutaneotrichosporon oleaginosum]|uniref:Uncharacterized protein n=1 Tax=Cutaneotrichosporon oleaginosum TaxID=879819 RepID=A0A0J1B2Q8_9TREE|nr:uncharacterized protein CC85DRAFT_292369 [Cutaneotrichosporon oleaginosum]KLT41884.1 hypothetical protein CC85DRAFT_292369 [Cutaneotrichosporon oleaginosum]
MKLLALLVTLAAATPISIDEPDTRQIGGKCYGVLDGWCPGSNAIKYVPSRAGCFELGGRQIVRPSLTGCHRIQRNTGKCDGPYDYVWIPNLGGCRWTKTGLCPGGADILYVM